MTVNPSREIELFKTYSSVYDESKAALAIRAIHLTRQLEVHISGNLDRALITRNVIDINSGDLYTCVRGQLPPTTNKVGVHELHYAKFIIQLAELLLMEDKGESLTEDQIIKYTLNKEQEFYFGRALAKLNNELVLACTPPKAEVNL